jgi:hypothetical protein
MGLEVVVRPVVFPNIRPTRPRVLAATSDSPDQGMVVLSGGGSTFVGTSYSYSYSYSSSKPHKEQKRQVYKVRVYQENKDGTINKDNYVDVDQMQKVLLTNEKEPLRVIFGDYKTPDNAEILEKDVTKISGKD